MKQQQQQPNGDCQKGDHSCRVVVATQDEKVVVKHKLTGKLTRAQTVIEEEKTALLRQDTDTLKK